MTATSPRHSSPFHHNSLYLLNGDVNEWLKGTELYVWQYQHQDVTSDPSSSNRIIIFAVFRNLWLIMNELVNYNDESWLKNMEDGSLPAPEDHIQNHINATARNINCDAFIESNKNRT